MSSGPGTVRRKHIDPGDGVANLTRAIKSCLQSAHGSLLNRALRLSLTSRIFLLMTGTCWPYLGMMANFNRHWIRDRYHERVRRSDNIDHTG